MPNFIDMLHEEPRILHISCHGLRLHRKQILGNTSATKELENFLLFERTDGEGHLVSSSELNT